jgi:hypothetical protein
MLPGQIAEAQLLSRDFKARPAFETQQGRELLRRLLQQLIAHSRDDFAQLIAPPTPSAASPRQFVPPAKYRERVTKPQRVGTVWIGIHPCNFDHGPDLKPFVLCEIVSPFNQFDHKPNVNDFLSLVWDILPAGWAKSDQTINMVAPSDSRWTAKGQLLGTFTTFFAPNADGSSVMVMNDAAGVTIAVTAHSGCQDGCPNSYAKKGVLPIGGELRTSSIKEEIERTEKTGAYTALPPPVEVAATFNSIPGGMAMETIDNHTVYTLKVLLSGPREQEITIAPGSEQTLTFPAGVYRVLGRASSPSIRPFLGQQDYQAGKSYRSTYEIHRP